MQKPLNLENVKVIGKGTLPKNGEEYTIVIQSTDNLDQVTAFHNFVYESQPDEEKSNLIDRDRSYFESHFEQGHVLLNVVYKDELIAQALLNIPTKEYPSTGMTDMDTSGLELEKIAVLNGMIVHPDYRGNKLQIVLGDERIRIAQEYGRSEILSEVAVRNGSSWSNLMREGLAIVSIGTDPDDGTQLYNLYKPLSKAFNKEAPRKTIVCSQFNLEAHKILCDLGFSATASDLKTQTMTFEKAESVAQAEPANSNTQQKKVPGLYQQGR